MRAILKPALELCVAFSCKMFSESCGIVKSSCPPNGKLKLRSATKLLDAAFILATMLSLTACKEEAPERLEFPLSLVARQSLNGIDLTVDGNRFPSSGKPVSGLEGPLGPWAWLREQHGEPVEEGSTFATYYPDARFAPFGPFDDVNVFEPAYVDWQTLEGTRARVFRVKSPICADSPGGFVQVIKCPERDAVLITPEVLQGVARMTGLERIGFTGMYSGTQEDLIVGLQAIVDNHNPESLGLGFVSEDGIPPDVCALQFGSALKNLVWVELASEYAPKYELTQEVAPTTIFSPFEIVRMQAQGEEIVTFQNEICGD